MDAPRGGCENDGGSRRWLGWEIHGDWVKAELFHLCEDAFIEGERECLYTCEVNCFEICSLEQENNVSCLLIW